MFIESETLLIQRRLPMIIECSSRIREWSVKMLISFYLHFLTTNLMLMKHPWVIKKRPVIKAHSVKGGSNSKGRRRRQSYVTCLLQKTSNQGWQGPFMVVKEAPREITFNGGPPKYQVVLKALTSYKWKDGRNDYFVREQDSGRDFNERWMLLWLLSSLPSNREELGVLLYSWSVLLDDSSK